MLPTNGTARFSSPLSVDDFVKKMSYLCYTEEAFPALPPYLHLLGARRELLGQLKQAALPASHSLMRLQEENAACARMVQAQLTASDFAALCRAKPRPMGGALRQKIIFLTN